MTKLETSYLGLKLKNPLVAASSGLTNSVEKIKELEEAGIGAVVLKSIFEEQINNEIGNLITKDPRNITYPEAEDYIRNYLRNNSVTQHLKLIEQTRKSCGIPVIASINCISSEEWTTFASDFEEAGADAIELNIFYVPTDHKAEPGLIERLYIDILSKVTQIVKIPVSVKIGPYFSNIPYIADKLKANGASGIVLFNRFYEPDINLDKLELSPSEIFSSPGDIRRILRWIGLVTSSVIRLDVAASTGIHDGLGVIKMLLAGAKVTQLCSTFYLNGSKVIGEMIQDLMEFMEKWNFKNVDDFRGRLSYKNIPDPMLYERSQFMKYFSSH